MKKRDFFSLSLAVDIIILDIVTKWLAHAHLAKGIEIIPQFLVLQLHKNPDLAFSIPFPNVMQIVLSVGLLVLLIVYWKQNQRTSYEHFALAAVFGGAVGNLSERILFGEVTDFIAVWQFPVFNVADISISLGVAVLLWSELFAKKKIKGSQGN